MIEDPLGGALSLDELEAAARPHISPQSFDYIAGGAEDELTLADNRAAFRRLRLLPRMLRGSDAVDTSLEVLGETLSLPLLLAPTALNRLVHTAGEAAAARAAREAGINQVVSTWSSVAVEQVAGELAPVRPWFQLYVYRDRGLTCDLIRRAEAAGCGAICLTVDAPDIGRRPRDIRNRFAPPPGVSFANLEGATTAGATFSEYIDHVMDASLGWADVDWVRDQTQLPLLIKGILRPDDAQRALERGVAGIVVSNHGGRQLDGSIATIDALPAVAQVVGGRVPVLLDGGVRRGTDVLKALALGARAVLIGRPYLWGLALGGAAGALAVIEMLRTELRHAMLLAGCARLSEIDRSLVAAGFDRGSLG